MNCVITLCMETTQAGAVAENVVRQRFKPALYPSLRLETEAGSGEMMTAKAMRTPTGVRRAEQTKAETQNRLGREISWLLISEETGR